MENNPEDWDMNYLWGASVYKEKAFPHIIYACDTPAIYLIPYIQTPYFLRDDNEIGDIQGEDLVGYYKILTIPGAYSVDKHYRLAMGYSWFEQEQLNKMEMEMGRALIRSCGTDFDAVLSHTCPIIFEPTDLFLSIIDQSSVDKTMERYLGEIEYKLDYRAWFWGHYHAFRDYPRTDGRKKLMLFNDKVIELADYLENEEFEIY
jgi:3-oxoacid CoA-transferase subunit A